MVTRRQFLKLTAGGASLLLTSRFGLTTKAYAVPLPGGTLDPLTIRKYMAPLFIPPAMPLARKLFAGGKVIDYYEIAVRQFRQQILPPGSPMTLVQGYGSPRLPASFNAPGCTIEAQYGTPVRVKWINDLKDASNHYLPPLLPIDPTLHWANPSGGPTGRDTHPDYTGQGVPGPYTGPVPIVTHLHGGHSHDDSDGYPAAWYLPDAGDIPAGYALVGSKWDDFAGQFQNRLGVAWNAGHSVYQYENDQRATMLWYHDHVLGMTRANVYAGLAGLYALRGGPGDQVLDAASGLAATLPGPAPGSSNAGIKYYEIPIALQDRAFNSDGSLFYPDSRTFFDGFTGPFIGDPTLPSDISPIWNPEFFGNTMVVNGRTWPYLEVEPRRYRFRILNGCGARFVILKLSDGTPFWQIGSDGGFLPQAVQLSQLLIAPAERVDVIIDFSGMAPGTRIVLENLGPDEPFGGGVPNVDFAASDPDTTGQVMEFRVVQLAGRDLSTPPDRLVFPAIAPQAEVGNTRPLSLNELSSAMVPDPADPGVMFGPQSATLGTMSAAGPISRAFGDPITEKPEAGVTEMWELYNFTEDAHPIHVHQTMFEVVNREIFDPLAGAVGTVTGPEPGETGRKDMVIAYPGQITRIKVYFDLRGFYVWHCHILEHEDNDMMRPFEVI